MTKTAVLQAVMESVRRRKRAVMKVVRKKAIPIEMDSFSTRGFIFFVHVDSLFEDLRGLKPYKWDTLWGWNYGSVTVTFLAQYAKGGIRVRFMSSGILTSYQMHFLLPPKLELATRSNPPSHFVFPFLCRSPWQNTIAVFTITMNQATEN